MMTQVVYETEHLHVQGAVQFGIPDSHLAAGNAARIARTTHAPQHHLAPSSRAIGIWLPSMLSAWPQCSCVADQARMPQETRE